MNKNVQTNTKVKPGPTSPRPRRRLNIAVWFVSLIPLIGISPLYADWAAGIPTGTEFPQIKALDHTTNERTNENLMGENGLLFYFNRSSDW